MKFRITQASSKLLLVSLCLMFLAGCAHSPTPPPAPDLTQLQIRQMQTREYSGVTELQVVKAVIGALMDEGFSISSTDKELGVITAAKEVYELDSSTKFAAEFNLGAGAGTYQTTLRSEASSFIKTYGKNVQVRISIVQKAVSNAGGNIWSQPVYNATVYQSIFSKVGKAVFLEKENM
ncbi:hypothetical protein [Halodesulfovibrio sp. MK-HDV]|jgi:hypothetical protein|uniref:hypothetical protein n=1 Tax=unclassified Halodesulfovibrio TaxID=2644657 RepID=UPI0013FBE231|nr:hypothetical protein [Halodesulfovibrio sp. MK-HDV]KAF1074692.1 hypothetical protein MKHDV_02486 [Halodesulfovibrio sp. MK-HDV]